jgi:uncharacterized protein involved in exopolysaccharide biosynthesis
LAYVQPVASEEVDAIDFRATARLLWSYRRLIAILSVVLGLAVMGYGFMLDPYFRAEAVVTYVHDKGMGNGSGSLDNALGGLASLAGMNLLGAGTEDEEAMAVLDSRHLAEEFIQRNNLIPVLLKNSKKTPTMWKAVKAFKEGVVQVHKDPRKGTTTVVMIWKDRDLAAKWANAYVALGNEEIRNHTIEQSARNIVYLNQQIAKTTDIDLRRLYFDILESETKTMMLANARLEYSFRMVDPAVAPEIKAGPHRSLFLLGGMMLGFMIGSGIAYVRDRTQRKRLAAAEQAQPITA